jgi:predicted TPR repeat methyltransferase
LFESYASDFQRHVTGSLDYRGHERLLQPLIASGRQFARALDLGCGTGLCGPLLRQLTDTVDGVDISQGMLEQAKQSGFYRKLTHADIAAFVAEEFERADLVVAADVFIYVGELSAIFAAVRRILMEDGCFAFTVETPTDDKALQLLPSLRYAHSENYIRELAQTCGFKVNAFSAGVIRLDQGQPVQGAYIYLG